MPAYKARIKHTGKEGVVLHTFLCDTQGYAVFEHRRRLSLEPIDWVAISRDEVKRAPLTTFYQLTTGETFYNGTGRCYTVYDHTRALDGEPIYIGYDDVFKTLTASRESRIKT